MDRHQSVKTDPKTANVPYSLCCWKVSNEPEELRRACALILPCCRFLGRKPDEAAMVLRISQWPAKYLLCKLLQLVSSVFAHVGQEGFQGVYYEDD